ncbi:MAG: class I SAM-dependent methyltransferase [Promethearchaeota archaeon]
MKSENRKLIEKYAYENKYENDKLKLLKARKWEIEKPHNEFNQRFVHSFNLGMIKRLFNKVKNKRILIVAAGPGMEAEYFEKQGARVYCTDISNFQIMNARLRKKYRDLKYDVIMADAENQPFREKIFDYCLIYESLHHIPKHTKVINQMKNITKEKIILCEPNSESLSSKITNFLKIKMTEWGFEMIKFNKPKIQKLFNEYGKVKITYGCVSVPNAGELFERLKLSNRASFFTLIINFLNILLNLIWYMNPKLGSAIIGYLDLSSN